MLIIAFAELDVTAPEKLLKCSIHGIIASYEDFLMCFLINPVPNGPGFLDFGQKENGLLCFPRYITAQTVARTVS